MMYTNKVFSPALLSDWYEFLANEKPDVETAITWLNENVPDDVLFGSILQKLKALADTYTPDDLYDLKTLKEWAKEHEFYNELKDFDSGLIIAYVNKYFSPEEVFEIKRLEETISSYGSLIKRENVIEKLDELQDKINEMINEIE